MVPGTGLIRQLSPFLRVVARIVIPLLTLLGVIKNVQTVPKSGGRIADLAINGGASMTDTGAQTPTVYLPEPVPSFNRRPRPSGLGLAPS